MYSQIALESIRKLFQPVNFEYYDFLDRATKHWVQKFHQKAKSKIEEENISSEQAIKYHLLADVMAFTELNCRRDFRLPQDLTEYKEAWNNLDELDKMREYVEHPTILATRGHLRLLSHNYSEASIFFEKALNLLKTSPLWQDYQRQQVLNLFDLTYSYICQGLEEKAIETANQCYNLSFQIEQEKDKKEMNRAFDPEDDSLCPYYGLIASCDARIHSKQWFNNHAIRGEFEYFWTRGVNEFKFPHSLDYRIKLALYSDPMWSFRVEHHLNNIAKAIYAQMNPKVNILKKNLTSFSIDFSKISKYSAVAILLIGLVNSGQLLATNNLDRIEATPVEILDHPNTYNFLSKESTDYQVNKLKNKVKKIIGEKNYHKSLSDIVIEMDSINNDAILWTGSSSRTTDYLNNKS